MLRMFKDLADRRLFGRQPSASPDDALRDFLLQSMPKHSVCAEIGVWKGDFSKRIVELVEPTKLHLIDPWRYEQDETYKDALYGGQLGGSQANMDKIYTQVMKRFRSEIKSGRVVVHRGYSHEVCEQFADDYFDWIYIDGNHLYEFASRDLQTYYHKVKKGGFIAGDDYSEGGWWQGGVKKAVDEFVAQGLVKLIDIQHKQYIVRK